MAQDATPANVLREAEAAGNDAAAEARAEVLKRSREAAGSEDRASPADEPEIDQRTAGKDPWHRFTVDVWITNFNSTEFGVYKRSRNKAKSRQFTSDMDVFAEIQENGERTGLIGYRQELWNKQTGFDKRLVFKLFGEKLNWRATMDLMLGRSVQETIGARGVAVPAFAINTNDHDQVVYLSRSANKWPMMPEHFSFFLIEEGQVKFYRLRQDLLSFGRDYSLFDGSGAKVGVLDGRLFTICGFWKCKVKREHADKRVLAVLKLFAGMLVFNNACRKHVRSLARDVERGVLVPKLQRQETDLYMNPRRVR